MCVKHIHSHARIYTVQHPSLKTCSHACDSFTVLGTDSLLHNSIYIIDCKNNKDVYLLQMTSVSLESNYVVPCYRCNSFGLIMSEIFSLSNIQMKTRIIFNTEHRQQSSVICELQQKCIWNISLTTICIECEE